jgi:hypothetical protein
MCCSIQFFFFGYSGSLIASCSFLLGIYEILMLKCITYMGGLE